MVSVFPSMKMLSFLAMVRVVTGAWAIAKLDTLEIRAITVVTTIGNLPLVLSSDSPVGSRLFPADRMRPDRKKHCQSHNSGSTPRTRRKNV